jgi:tRNA A-37 threonylcarbamoyl transferase component Bud32
MIFCRSDVYKLVQDLHSIGMVHEDLEPRSIVRTHGSGFLLIDFSENGRHVYKESKVQYMGTWLS